MYTRPAFIFGKLFAFECTIPGHLEISDLDLVTSENSSRGPKLFHYHLAGHINIDSEEWNKIKQ